MKNYQKSLITLLIFLMVFNFVAFVPNSAKAQLIVSDVAAGLWDKFIYYGGKVVDLVERSANVAWKNALRTFLSRIAYDTATRIAEGNWGQSPLFDIKNMSAFLDDVAQTTLVDTLDFLASENGFLEFDICQPQNLNLRFAIHYSLFNEYAGRGAPRCTLNEIVTNWTEWRETVGRTYSSDNFLNTLRGAFSPEESDIGAYLTVDSSIRNQIEDEQLKEMFDRIARQGVSNVTEPISGYIKTPSLLVGYQAQESLVSNQPVSDTTRTGDIVADAFGVFTNTLASKLIKKLLDDGLTEGDIARSTAVYNNYTSQIRSSAEQNFASLADIDWQAIDGPIEILSSLSQCPDKNNPGPTNCVMPNRMISAIEQKLTVQQAIDKGILKADAVFGFNTNGSQPDYTSGYPYRSLIIMRQFRIIPVGWELAALYAYQFDPKKTTTLKQLIDCFEDSDPNYSDDNTRPISCQNDDGINPYHHLVDPNWVLKAPQAYCESQGAGAEIISSVSQCLYDNVTGTILKSTGDNVDGDGQAHCDGNLYQNPDQPVIVVQRNTDYCADWQTCLKEDANGNCLSRGYCLEEEPIWRFEGDICEEQYNTCETLTRQSDGRSFSYLRNTLQECQNSGDAGCMWYSVSAEQNSSQELIWQPEERIYLNNQAEACDSGSAGCTKLSQMLPGSNLVFNGNFAGWQDGEPVDWSFTTSGGSLANFQQEEDNGQLKMTVSDFGSGNYTGAMTNGYIPIDPQFDYQFSYKAKSSGTGEQARARLRFYDGNNSLVSTSLVSASGLTTDYRVFSENFLASELNNSIKYLRVDLNGPLSAGSSGTVWFDEVQMVITSSPITAHNDINFTPNPEIYQLDYSQNDSYGRQYLKVAPDYLGCQGYNEIVFAYTSSSSCSSAGYFWRNDISRCVVSGDNSCANYASYCSAEEVGCQGYQPINGDPEVSAVATSADICPQECVGYDSYLESPTFFDVIEDSAITAQYQSFIPDTALACEAVYAGCEEFTNLDEVSSGGEGIEYFTKIRQCISPNNSDLNFYYTWEGSDTSGYQLKKWTLLGSNIDSGPCTNIGLGSEVCTDTVASQASCSAEEAETNFDCREFISTEGDQSFSFWRLESRVVTASGDCAPYRRSATGEVYNIDSSGSFSCPASADGCREYRGNQGNNVRNIINENFEGGTIGSWENTSGSAEGLNYSNESTYVSGHSLKVAVNNDMVVYPLGNSISAGKQYILSFWAKKAASSSGKYNSGSIPSGDSDLSFTLSGLTNDWFYYEGIGPLELDSVSADSQLTIQIAGLLSNEVYYLDNIILKEYTDNFYAIKDSWITPNSCDLPNVGSQLGCQQYTDRQDNTVYLKQFSNICSASAIGCEAYLDTQNSSFYQSEKIYQNGVCDAEVGIIDGGGDCSIRGVLMCNVGTGTSCNYETAVVSNDEIVYLVNDPAKECGSTYQGCQLLGQPTLDQRFNEDEDGYITGYSNVYINNNPDNYDATLCSASGLFCEAFVGETTGQHAYFDPLGLTKETSKTCYYNDQQGKWLRSGTDEECYNGQFLPEAGQYNYEGWVGVCPGTQASCTEFRDPEAPVSTDVARCDATISNHLSGLCPTGNNVTINGSTYCQIDANGDGTTENVCKNSGGVWSCAASDGGRVYTETGWYCVGSSNSDCYVGGVKVCRIEAGQTDCQYSLACTPYYYQSDSVETGDACNNGTIDREAGCLPFYDTSNSNLTWASSATADGSQPTACDPDATFGSDNYCNANSYYSVSRDRQCAEWLQCGTAIDISDNSGSDYACVDLIRCSKNDSSGRCSEIVPSTSTPSENIYTPDTVDQLRNLSGYSKVGFEWPNGETISGYYSPENMSQLGVIIDVENGSFEDFDPTASDNIPGWLANVPNSSGIYSSNSGSCGYQISNDSPADGYYSLAISLNTDQATSYFRCPFSSRSGNVNGLYPIDSDNQYNLSFYAKATQGTPRIKLSLAWYDASGNLCTEATCGSASGLSCSGGNVGCVSGKSFSIGSSWQKYLVAIGEGGEVGIPANAAFARIFIDNWYQPDSSISNTSRVQIDQVDISPALKLSDDLHIGTDCRLYPQADSPSCSYQSDLIYEGWSGYCLEPDPYYQTDPLDPDNYQRCLQWYPVDAVQGDSVSSLSKVNLGYDNRRPLYYCLQSEGNYPYLREVTPSGTNRTDGSNWCKGSQGSDDGGEGNNTDYTNSGIFCAESEDWLWESVTYSTVSGVDDFSKYEIESVSFYAVWSSSDNQWPRGEFAEMNWDEIVSGDFKRIYSHTSGNYINIKFNFNSVGILESYTLRANDISGDWGAVAFYPIFRLKEVCTAIAQVVDSEGNEKVWLNRFDNNQWPVNSGNTLGLNQSMNNARISPYGAVDSPNNDLPSTWRASSNLGPLVVYSTDLEIIDDYNAGLPLSISVPNSVPADQSGRVCISGPVVGQSCDISDDGTDSTAFDCSNSTERGVCMGIGKFCYSDNTGLTNGQPCGTGSDCAENYTCELADNFSSLDANLGTAIERLQSLFAKIYGVWTWSNASGQYQALNEGLLRVYYGTVFDISDTVGSDPKISNITITPLEVTAPGGLVNLSFSAFANADQLPIESITVNWQDGSQDSYEGPFDSGTRNLYHFYQCVTDPAGRRCIACPSPGSLSGDACIFPAPTINITDHWNRSSNNVSTPNGITISP